MPWADGDRLDSTNLNNKLPSGLAFNVKDAVYGAVGDGVTDDTAAIQAALDAAKAAGGGIVFIPPGQYNVTSLSLVLSYTGISASPTPELVTIVGAGQASQINITNTDATAGITLSGGGYFAHFHVCDLALYGNEQCGDGLVLDFLLNRSVVERVSFYRFPKAGTGTVPIRTAPETGVSGYAALRLKNAINTLVLNCFADNVNTGCIVQGQCDRCVFVNFTVYGYKRAGIDVVVGLGADLATYITSWGVSIIEPYFYGRRGAYNSEYTPTDDSLGLAANGSDNGRYGIKTEGASRIQIRGGWYEQTEFAIFAGQYDVDLSGSGGDEAGSGAISANVNNQGVMIEAPRVGGSYSPTVYVYAPSGGDLVALEPSMTVTLAGGSMSKRVFNAQTFSGTLSVAGAASFDGVGSFADYLTATKGVLAGGSSRTAYIEGLRLSSASGFGRGITWYTGNTKRWELQGSTDTESGSDVGSDLKIFRYDDAGDFNGTAFTLARTSAAASFSGALTSAATLTAPTFVSSTTTSQSGATASLGQGQLFFSVLSLTTNGAEFGFRSGNTVYRFFSDAVG